MCKQCDKRGQHETVRCLIWMCWACSSVNGDQHIYVERSDDVKGLIWSCHKCIVNKVDVITSINKIIEQHEEEIEEVREKVPNDTASVGAVTANTSCCANCVEPSRFQLRGPDSPFLGMPTMRTRWMDDASAHKSG